MSKSLQAVILGIMCLILTIGICVQIKTVNSNGTTTSSNQQLNNLKTQVLKMKEKYEISYEELERKQEELEITRNNVASADEKLKALEEEIKKYNVLLGTTEVTGPGVTITLSESNTNIAILYQNGYSDDEDISKYLIHDTDLLEIVNELRNAGAEAIEINGQRITNSTSITCDGNVILINGEKVGPLFTINAIGYGARMATLKRTGGILQAMEISAIKTTFNEVNKITIPKYAGSTTFKYAKTVK